MTVQMIDCSISITSPLAKNLKNAGVTHIARYLSKKAKGLTATEVAILKAAGLNIVSIYETAPINADYFHASQGDYDLQDAYNLAKAVGQPEVERNAIYFPVDYGAKPADFPAILSYFQTIKNRLTSYKVGAYGDYDVLNFLHQNNAADYYFQTYAWSGGNKCSFANLYQYQNDVTFQGIQVDYDQILTPDVGAWGAVITHTATTSATPVTPSQPAQTISFTGIATIVENTVVRKGPSPSFDIVEAVTVGGVYNVYGYQDGWYNVGNGWISAKEATFLMK